MAASAAFSTLSEELKRENIAVQPFATRGKSAVPKECDAVYVLGPTKAFSSEEAEMLKRYVDAGGNVLLALDPVISEEKVLPTGLEEVAQAWGIGIDADVVVELDEQQLLSPSPIEHFLVSSFGNHKVVQPLASLRAPVVLALARSLSAA